jgi:hypothetical protein
MAIVEHDVKVIPIDEEHKAKVDELAKQGWDLAPGTKPIGIYHVVRVKPADPAAEAAAEAERERVRAGDREAPGIRGRMFVDASKVFILKPDGSMQ